MRTAIMYTPEKPDNYYTIIAEANMMNADSTQFRNAVESATIAGFNFYVIAVKDEETNIKALECWYVDTFRRTWKFTTEQEHNQFKEIERI